MTTNSFDDSESVRREWLESFASRFAVRSIFDLLDEISRLNVGLVGEIIIDKYTFVDALSKSSKDPILAFRLGRTSTFPGGILAIASNISGWVKSVQILSSCRTGDETSIFPMNLAGTSFHLISTDSPTITKHRYVDQGTNAKVFETYDFDPNFFSTWKVDEDIVSSAISSCDLTIVADYGHGLMTPEMIQMVTNFSNYICVNVQSNAGNRGFNTFDKYERFNFFTANSGELQIQSRLLNPNYDYLMRKLLKTKSAHMGIMTEGQRGLTIFTDESSCSAPSLAVNVLDKVGAGDSVLAISSLLAYVGAPIDVIAFLSNLVAAREVSLQGHQDPLSIDQLKEQILRTLR